ncbi:tyrosine phosphatase family protein [Minwuia thermotolerans]|uniref:Protein-tyrosine-phosphatase n=1 Tax=Minwuia thermotolerans TaxID=2056226 RepID=A0A2M9FWS1_9PROT|nr:protein-tyrosine-phosphatase [Minwuia thermotolerans]PJK27915.1 protein-tyrosine-phosphatase [Minwuia thermotolerans]
MISIDFTICGVEELDRELDGRISHVVSIGDPGWPENPALDRIAPGRVHRFRFNDVIAAVEGHDRVPAPKDIVRLLEAGDRIRADDPTHLLVHCQMGVSRSSAATLILLTQEHPGREMEVADRISKRRPQAWPNSLMLELADAELGRNGGLIAAGREVRRRTASHRPDFADYLRGTHRRAEVEELDP